MFDKEEYWKRREAGKRGQGDEEKLDFEPKHGQHLVQIPGKGLTFINREQSRRRVIDRSATKKKTKGRRK